MSVYRNLLILSVCVCSFIASSASAFQTREWGTYYGGENGEELDRVRTDPAGNFYVLGTTKSTTKIIPPSKVDLAHSPVLDGSQNAYLAKFNSAGVMQWATYYGDSYTRGVKLIVDSYGSVYVLGIVNCPSTALATEYAEDKTCDGESDLFLVKFRTDGSRDWGRYIGGDGSEDNLSFNIVHSFALVEYDTHPGYIYVHGRTESKTGLIPKNMPSLDDTYNGGTYDSFIAKFGSTGNMIWARYFGGNNDDHGKEIACKKSTLPGDDICYIIGRTNSTSGIATNGAWDTKMNGQMDGYLARVAGGKGEVIWSTYYGGAGWDQGGAVAFDNFSNVYIAGSTNSSDSMTQNASQPNYGGQFDMFLAKFSPNGVRQWGTYLGSSGDEYIEDMTTDSNGNVYLSGTAWSNGGNNQKNLATPGVYDGSLNGITDAILAKYNPVGTRLRTMYYGGAGQEYSASVAVDPQNSIYLCGGTTSTSSITTFGVHQTLHGGDSYDGFCAKFLQ